MSFESFPINFKLFKKINSILKVFCISVKTIHRFCTGSVFLEFMLPKSIARVP